MRRANEPQPDGGGKPRLTTAIAAGLAVAAVLYIAGEWALMQPRASENEDLVAKLEVLRIENARTEQMIAGYGDFKHEADEVERRFDTALAAVPTEAELASVLEDLEAVTSASGVSLVRFTPATAASPRAPAPAKSDAHAASPARVTVESRPIAAVVRCGFDDYRELLARLASYPRLLTVESFSMKSAAAGRYTVEAAVEMNCYFKKAPAEALAPRGK